MLSMNGKRFGLRTTLGAVALGLGLAGAVSVSAPAKADGWHHGHGGYGGLLQKARNHLRRNHVARVVEQLNGRSSLRWPKRDRILAEAVRNDESDLSIARFDGSLGGGGGVIRLLNSLLRHGFDPDIE